MLRKNKDACPNCSLTCANCDFYDAEHVVETVQSYWHPNVSPFTSVGGCVTSPKKVKGACKLNPNPIHKSPDEWCGQHSEYRK